MLFFVGDRPTTDLERESVVAPASACPSTSGQTCLKQAADGGVSEGDRAGAGFRQRRIDDLIARLSPSCLGQRSARQTIKIVSAISRATTIL